MVELGVVVAVAFGLGAAFRLGTLLVEEACDQWVPRLIERIKRRR